MPRKWARRLELCINEIKPPNTTVGFEEMTKREAKRVGIALGITALILVPGFFFVTGVSLPMGEGINVTPAENIRHFTRFRIVPPEWVTPGTDGLYWSWMKAESIARLSIVVVAWFLAMIFVNPDKWNRRKSNNELESIVA